MPTKSEEFFIGLMSGTSIDAIDASIISVSDNQINIVSSHTHSIPKHIKKAIIELCQPGENEIDRMGKLDFELGNLFAEATLELLRQANLKSSQISAIGSHGQTIRHAPNGDQPYTLQISNPARICQVTGITTVADFRRADMAAGGQGAPLVPAFHHAIFYEEKINRVVLNIGGMANISVLNKLSKLSGFDTGPGNILLNEWIHHSKNLAYDKNGDWSKANTYNEDLLKPMLNDEYFSRLPPKSTGREYFNLDWIKSKINSAGESAGSIQSTLCELTIRTISDAIKLNVKDCQQILVCGGGIHNQDMIARLRNQFSMEVISTNDIGVDPDYVEAAAFGWFARQALHGLPANVPIVTGANNPVIMGAIYPALSA